MKSAYLLFTFVLVVFLGFLVPQSRADGTNDMPITNISVQPHDVKVGDTFTITATLANNFTVPIMLDGGKCSIKDTQAQFFTISLDNHTGIKSKNMACAGVGWSQILDPGKNIVQTSPDSTFSYIATKSGNANVTVTFHYYMKNQTDPTQPNIEQTVSKSLLFIIYDNDTITNHLKSANSPIVNKIPSPLQQFKSGIASNDVKCKGGFTLITKASNNMPACVTLQTYYNLVNRGWTILQNTTTTAWIFVNDTRYDIPYIIRGWNNDLSSSITFDSEHTSLIVPIKSVAEKGEITLTIPKSLLDSNLGLSTPFVVLVDGLEAKHTEVMSSTARMFTIPFEFGAQKIEIIAPQKI